MGVTIHLVTVVGGHVATLPQMLEHYRALGIESFFVNLHRSDAQDPAAEQVLEITREFGCGVAAEFTGDWQRLQKAAYARQREQYPRDWFVLADVDEFHRYPSDLRATLEECEREGYDYVRGCFVDRIASDGRFPPVDPARPLGEQFPLGAYLSQPVLAADPRKVVAVKGALPIFKGQHHADAGVACPARRCFVQVHHFKWTEGIAARLAKRVELLKREGFQHWYESARFLEYHTVSGGAVILRDPILHVAEADPEYGEWEAVRKLALQLPKPRLEY